MGLGGGGTMGGRLVGAEEGYEGLIMGVRLAGSWGGVRAGAVVEGDGSIVVVWGDESFSFLFLLRLRWGGQ